MKIPSIGTIIDWFGKNISRIKTCGLILLLILFIISFVNNGCNREYANTLIERITGLDVQNDILNLHNRSLQDSLIKERELRIELERHSTVLERERVILATDNAKLKKRLAEIPVWLLNLPADSSYKFLDEEAYPYTGEKRFPFNEPQIKNIHADYLENVTLKGLVVNLENEVVNCTALWDNADSLAHSYMKSYKAIAIQKENLIDEVSNTEEKATMYKEALDKTNRGKTFWKVTTGVLTVVTMILLI